MPHASLQAAGLYFFKVGLISINSPFEIFISVILVKGDNKYKENRGLEVFIHTKSTF